MSYQDIIYEISKYIKPEKSEKFKSEYGIKQLSNQVIELNKLIYYKELKEEILDYYITDKIDGKRAILYISNNESYEISDKLEKIDIRLDGINIIDCEKYKNEYYIFDVMVYNNKNIVNEKFRERKKYFEKFKSIGIKEKKFIKLEKNYKKQIKELKKEKKEYEIDGIIFTPENGRYNDMRVYKYKSIDDLTIDFLIKKNINNNNYILFCGISRRVLFKLRMRLIENYEKYFNINTNNLPDYLPIQFEPSNFRKAYYYNNYNENNKDNNKNKNLDGEIGEFRYDIKEGEWKLKKIREDRKIEVERGNYFGNNYKIAENIWMSYSNILNIEDEEKEENMYFEVDNNELQKASRNYNSYVKTEIFKNIQNTEWVMDLASGKGQDLFRYSEARVKNIIFLEIDKMALEELINRKHSFSNDSKYRNSMKILIQNVDLLDDYNKNIRKVDNVYNSNKIDLIMCNLAFHYFMKDKKSMENIIKLIDHYLNKNGRFIMMAFDGDKINKLLKENDEWTIKVNNKIKYSIRKKYDGKKIEGVGQKIEVILPFSGEKYYEEYLINIEEIQKEFNKYNIKLLNNKSFLDYYNNYHKDLDDNDKKYVDLYHYYLFKKL